MIFSIFSLLLAMSLASAIDSEALTKPVVPGHPTVKILIGTLLYFLVADLFSIVPLTCFSLSLSPSLDKPFLYLKNISSSISFYVSPCISVSKFAFIY